MADGPLARSASIIPTWRLVGNSSERSHASTTSCSTSSAPASSRAVQPSSRRSALMSSGDMPASLPRARQRGDQLSGAPQMTQVRSVRRAWAVSGGLPASTPVPGMGAEGGHHAAVHLGVHLGRRGGEARVRAVVECAPPRCPRRVARKARRLDDWHDVLCVARRRGGARRGDGARARPARGRSAGHGEHRCAEPREGAQDRTAEGLHGTLTRNGGVPVRRVVGDVAAELVEVEADGPVARRVEHGSAPTCTCRAGPRRPAGSLRAGARSAVGAGCVSFRQVSANVLAPVSGAPSRVR